MGVDESMAPEGGKFANGVSVSGDDKGLAVVELAHDFATVVAQLALGDFGSHSLTVARVLQWGCGTGFRVCVRSSGAADGYEQ